MLNYINNEKNIYAFIFCVLKIYFSIIFCNFTHFYLYKNDNKLLMVWIMTLFNIITKAAFFKTLDSKECNSKDYLPLE